MALWLGLSVGAAMAGPALAAPDRDVLTPAAITAFEHKLDGARTVQADIARRVACFDQQKLGLIAQRDRDQLRLGALLRHGTALEPVLVAQAAEYKAFEATRDAEQARLDRLHVELTDLQSRKEAQERALADCKARPWTLNILCDAAYGLAHLTGHFVDNEKQIGETRGRLDNAAQDTATSEQRYRDSKAAYDLNAADAAATAAQVSTAEISIGHLQAALSTLETNAYDSKLLLDEFDDALDEARRVDTADGQARTARAVRGLAVRVDEAAQRSSALLNQATTTLTEQQLRSCL